MDSDLRPVPRPVGERHVVVIGGGIAGLAAAYEITQLAPDVRVTLLEAAGRLGGKIATEQVDGFRIEAGPDSFLSAKPRGIGLCQDLGIADHLQGVTAQKDRAYILLNGAMHPIPEGLTGLVPTRLTPLARSSLLTWPGKMRVALDYVLPSRREGEDEAVGHFVRRRLGNQAWERLVEPLMAGIYAANGDELSLNATFPQLRQAELEHGGLIRGVLAARNASPTSPPRSPFLAPIDGMGELVSTLEQRLRSSSVDFRLNTAAREITPLSRLDLTRVGIANKRRGCRQKPSPPAPLPAAGRGENFNVGDAMPCRPPSLSRLDGGVPREWVAAGGETSQHAYRVILNDGQAIDTDAVILATPAHATAPLLSTIAPDIARELDAIPHASTALVSLAYRRDEIPHPLDAHGYVVPRIAGGSILAGTWSSRKWAHRAPEGWELLRVFIGRSGQSLDLMTADDAALLDLARSEVRKRLGVDASPALSRVQRWPMGMPHYVMGHTERIARIEAAMCVHPGLALAGNAYHGVGIPDCISSGEQAAHVVLRHLSEMETGTVHVQVRSA